MFAIAVAELDGALQREGVSAPPEKAEAASLHLRLLCARCYLAGVMTGKGQWLDAVTDPY